MAKKIWGGKKISDILKDAEIKHQKISDLFNDAQNSANNIKSLLQSILGEETKIKNIILETDSSKEGIIKLEEEVSALKSSTEELVNTNREIVTQAKDELAYIAGASLSNTFEKRRDILNTSARRWLYWLLGNIICLVCVAFIVFLELKGTQTLTTGFFIKLSLSFPFIYAAIFFHSQYNHERNLEEEYAFKSAVSFSLDSYRKVINEEIDDTIPAERMRLVEFVIDTIKGVYTSPVKQSGTDKTNSQGTLEKIKDIVESIANLAKH